LVAQPEPEPEPELEPELEQRALVVLVVRVEEEPEPEESPWEGILGQTPEPARASAQPEELVERELVERELVQTQESARAWAQPEEPVEELVQPLGTESMAQEPLVRRQWHWRPLVVVARPRRR